MYSAASMYGASTQMPSATATPIESVAPSAPEFNGLRSFVDPKNPLVVLGLILAATIGAVGVAGSARVGPARASGSLGKT